MAMMQHVLAVSVMLLAVQTVAIDQVCADQATCESSLANEAVQASALLQTHSLSGTVKDHKFKEETSPSSDETLQDLQAKKKAAIDAEDFDTAKTIKEQIASLEASQKQEKEQMKADLEQQKKDAILAEDFDTAKKIKEQLAALEGMTTAEKTEVEALNAENKAVEATAEKTEVEATAEKKEVEATAEKTEVEATAEKTELEAAVEMMQGKATAENQKIEKTELEAAVEMMEGKATAQRRAAMEPGCYVLLPTGCHQGDGGDSSDGETLWTRDEWGETNVAAAENQTACLQTCRDHYDEYCGVNDTQMMYVSPVDSAGEQTAVKSMRSLLQESFIEEEAKEFAKNLENPLLSEEEFAENLEKPAIEDGDENDSSNWW